MARTISKQVWIERFITLEDIVDQSLGIWHTFFGLSGVDNDINVLNWSPIIANLLNGVGNVICGYLRSLKVLNTITIHGFLSCPSWLPCPPWLMNSYPSLIFKTSQSLKIEKDFFFKFHLFSPWLVPLQSENFRLEFIYFLCISHFQIRGWGEKKNIYVIFYIMMLLMLELQWMSKMKF